MNLPHKPIPYISKYANIAPFTPWTIVYFNPRVQQAVQAMPAGVLADYLRLCDAMTLFGADLRMPHSRALGDRLFELRAQSKEGIGRFFYGVQRGKTIVILHCFVEKNTGNTRQRNAIGQKTFEGSLK